MLVHPCVIATIVVTLVLAIPSLFIICLIVCVAEFIELLGEAFFDILDGLMECVDFHIGVFGPFWG